MTDVIQIEKESLFRPVYAGNAIAELEMPPTPRFLSVRPTNFAGECSGMENNFENLDVKKLMENFSSRVTVEENVIQKSDRPDLVSARVVLGGGRAFKSKENFDILY